MILKSLELCLLNEINMPLLIKMLVCNMVITFYRGRFDSKIGNFFLICVKTPVLEKATHSLVVYSVCTVDGQNLLKTYSLPSTHALSFR